MASVSLEKLNKTFTDTQTKKEVAAVKDLDIQVKDGEFLVLVGPSGCGKTTALRMIAGLEDVSGGAIRIGERVVNDVPPRDRNIAMVFQNYALYPHMNVYDNMAFGLRLRMLPGGLSRFTNGGETKKVNADIDQRIREAAELLGITHLLDRKPKALSGGQRQRVALGRAIVREPEVFLMDEPLSNLDAKLRVQTRAELIKLHRRLGVTTVYVTHDQVEAMTMGERIAVMKDGVLQQCDTPLELYHRPANVFVAGFLGTPSMNFFEAICEYSQDDSVPLNAGDFAIQLPPKRAASLKNYAGQTVIAGVRPEDIHDAALVPQTVGATLKTRMNVDVTEPMGAVTTAYLTAGSHTLVANLEAETKAQIGAPLDVAIDLNAIHVFDKATERAIT